MNELASRMPRSLVAALATIGILVFAAMPAAAQDKVRVGVFPVSSSLPYFVALERGFFKEQNIDPETIRLAAASTLSPG